MHGPSKNEQLMRSQSFRRPQAPAELTLKTKLVCLYARIAHKIIELLDCQNQASGLPKEAMILTRCAQCAAPLGHNAPRCGICKLRYCGRECQKRHWKVHKPFCPEIKRGGGAEQYNADKKYKEFVAVAVEKCAADTKGQTCYICTEAVHWKTKEGLVRGCACRGTSGCAHVSCLAEQAKILCDEAEENNLDLKVQSERFGRWDTCRLCEQQYHGVVAHALGWACWKTYVGRPEADDNRILAMETLGNGLSDAKHYEEALPVREAVLSIRRRLGDHEENMLVAQSNLSLTYHELERFEEALTIKRYVYSERLKLNGEEHAETLREALNYASSLCQLKRFEEAKSVLRKMTPVARRVLGECHENTLMMRRNYAVALYADDGATLDDLREAVTMLEDTERIGLRVLGGAHPTVEGIEVVRREAQRALSLALLEVARQRESPDT